MRCRHHDFEGGMSPKTCTNYFSHLESSKAGQGYALRILEQSNQQTITREKENMRWDTYSAIRTLTNTLIAQKHI
jgi:hypothetical protein